MAEIRKEQSGKSTMSALPLYSIKAHVKLKRSAVDM